MTISDEVFKTLFRPLIDENEEENLDDDIYVDQDYEEEDEDEEYYDDDEYEDENEEEYYTVDDTNIDALDTLIENLRDMRRIVDNPDHQYTIDQINRIEEHIRNLERDCSLLSYTIESYSYID